MTPQEVSPVNTLHPGDVALKELLRGALNRVTCTSCATEFLLDIPMVFRDDESRFLVYLTDADAGDKWQEAEAQMRTLTEGIFAGEGDLPECRLTFTRKAFIEKILLHMHGLDDRIMEYVKYQLYRRPGSDIDPVRNELRYDFSSNGDDLLAFIVFDRESGRATAGAHIPMDVYRELVDMFRQDDGVQTELDLLFPGPYVSVERVL